MSQLSLSGGDIPDYLVDLIILKFVKDSIRAYHDIVQVVDTALFQRILRLTGHDTLNTAKMRKFSLTVAKSTADRKSSWEYSVGTDERIFFIITILIRR